MLDIRSFCVGAKCLQFNNTITDECAVQKEASVLFKVFGWFPHGFQIIIYTFLHCVCVNFRINNTRLSNKNSILPFQWLVLWSKTLLKHTQTKTKKKTNQKSREKKWTKEEEEKHFNLIICFNIVNIYDLLTSIRIAFYWK